MRTPTLAIIGVLFYCLVSPAGWICIKNDTKVSVVIQELPDGVQGKRGKLIRLHPGEVYREYQPAAGEKKVNLYDTTTPDKPLYNGKITWTTTTDISLKVQPDGKALKLAPVLPVSKVEAASATIPAAKP